MLTAPAHRKRWVVAGITREHNMNYIGKNSRWLTQTTEGLTFTTTCVLKAAQFESDIAGKLACMLDGVSVNTSHVTKCGCNQCSPSQPNNMVIINGEGLYLSVLSEVGCKFRECVLNADLFSEERAKYVVFLFPRLRAIPVKTPCQCHRCVHARHDKIDKALEQHGDTKTMPSWYNDDALAEKKGA